MIDEKSVLENKKSENDIFNMKNYYLMGIIYLLIIF